MFSIEVYSNGESFRKVADVHAPDIYHEVLKRGFPMVVVTHKLDDSLIERFNIRDKESVIITVFNGNELVDAFSVNNIEKKQELFELIKKETR